MLGKIIVLNGTSSSGKTTLSRHAQEFGLNVVSRDAVRAKALYEYLNQTIEGLETLKSFMRAEDFRKILFGYKIKLKHYTPEEREFIESLGVKIGQSIVDLKLPVFDLYRNLYDESKKFLYSGQDVILDLVLFSDDDINMLFRAFLYYPMRIMCLFTTLEDSLKQCLNRNYLAVQDDGDILNYRDPIWIVVHQYMQFYKIKAIDDVILTDTILTTVNLDSYRDSITAALSSKRELLQHIAQLKFYFDEVVDEKYTQDTLELLQDWLKIGSSNTQYVLVPRIQCDTIIYRPNTDSTQTVSFGTILQQELDYRSTISDGQTSKKIPTYKTFVENKY